MMTEIVVRAATKEDAELLASFQCSQGPPWEEEAQRFIQGLPAWLFELSAADLDPRALLLLNPDDASNLVAVAAHERISEILVDGIPLEGTKAVVVAAALSVRGTRIGTDRPGDLAFDALRRDALSRPVPRGRALVAKVARGNQASLAMCDRQGLNVKLDVYSDPQLVWRIGEL